MALNTPFSRWHFFCFAFFYALQRRRASVWKGILGESSVIFCNLHLQVETYASEYDSYVLSSRSPLCHDSWIVQMGYCLWIFIRARCYGYQLLCEWKKNAQVIFLTLGACKSQFTFVKFCVQQRGQSKKTRKFTHLKQSWSLQCHGKRQRVLSNCAFDGVSGVIFKRSLQAKFQFKRRCIFPTISGVSERIVAPVATFSRSRWPTTASSSGANSVKTFIDFISPTWVITFARHMSQLRSSMNICKFHIYISDVQLADLCRQLPRQTSRRELSRCVYLSETWLIENYL